MTHDSCEHYQELASALADGGLGTGEMQSLQGHLGSCAPCREFLGNISLVRDLLLTWEGSHPLEGAGAGFASSISRRVSRERVFVPKGQADRSSRSRHSFWGRLSGAAAAAVLLLAAGWSWHGLSTGPGEAPVTAVSSLHQQEAEEGSVAAYLREHALETMDATLLGPSEGMELASFEVLRQSFE